GVRIALSRRATHFPERSPIPHLLAGAAARLFICSTRQVLGSAGTVAGKLQLAAGRNRRQGGLREPATQSRPADSGPDSQARCETKLSLKTHMARHELVLTPLASA